MNAISRRDVALAGVGMLTLSRFHAPGAAHADDVASPQIQQRSTMDIQRIRITEPTGGIPVISFVTIHAGLVYLCGVTADANKLGDVKDQTRQVLERIDQLLARAGTSKSKMLTAQVWLTDMSLFADHNEAWNAWVDSKSPPVRACLHSPALWWPGMLVEIMATAAL